MEASNAALLFFIIICFPFASSLLGTNLLSCNISMITSCSACLYFVPEPSQNFQQVADLFGTTSDMITEAIDNFLVTVNCSCDPSLGQFLAHINYKVKQGDTTDNISMKFQNFAVDLPKKTIFPGQIIRVGLVCGCVQRVQVVTYRVVMGDTLYIIGMRFNADLNQTSALNQIDDPSKIHTGEVIFVPAKDLQHLVSIDSGDPIDRKGSNFQHLRRLVTWIVAAVIVLTAIAAIIFLWFILRGKGKSVASIYGIKWLSCCLPRFYHSTALKTSTHHHTSFRDSEVLAVKSSSSEKVVVFTHYEICEATANFNASKKLGQGSCGAVYHGRLRGREVAIKQMKNTKSREFLAELNILCKVNHSNLIELTGYAAGGESLFLVYEFAQNGTLSDHLHGIHRKGFKPLSWTMRVQIALDAAKGLDYIHENTKPYFVHRDVKTSNILLDSCFRAKISDFGLVKLLEHSPEIGTATSKIVGTFGYLPPEYVRDGCVTPKNDVYAYGVVLMELITGKPALSRSSSDGNAENIEHRSLVSFMLSTLDASDDPGALLAQFVDPNLTYYQQDSLIQMALLAKACVDEDRYRRPDMHGIILRLSDILACSLEWEAATEQHSIQDLYPLTSSFSYSK
ncbi:hypothetical protein AMTRI_Chr05g72030 [Amborella trichopoda]